MHYEIHLALKPGKQLTAKQRMHPYFSEAPKIGAKTVRRDAPVKLSEKEMKLNEVVVKRLLAAEAVEVYAVADDGKRHKVGEKHHKDAHKAPPSPAAAPESPPLEPEPPPSDPLDAVAPPAEAAPAEPTPPPVQPLEEAKPVESQPVPEPTPAPATPTAQPEVHKGKKGRK